MVTPGAPLSLAERAARYLAALPPALAGSGGHDAAARAAGAMVHGFCLDEETALALLKSHFNPGCKPPWTDAELAHKVRSIGGSPSAKGRGYLLRYGDPAPAKMPPRGMGPALPIVQRWPEPSLARIREIVASGPKVRELAGRSPVPAADLRPGDVLPALFADVADPDPLLCVGKSSREFATRRLSTWTRAGGLAGFAFVVPSPMSARTGRTRDGRESEHTLANTGPRRFVVVEFDFKPFTPAGVETRWAPLVAEWRAAGRTVHDACVSLLWHLSGFAPMALVVHSGGVSCHGWFPTGGRGDADGPERFMRYAATVGADPATWTRSQFVRLPGGTRDSGTRQRVLHFDPGAMMRPAGGNGKGATN